MGVSTLDKFKLYTLLIFIYFYLQPVASIFPFCFNTGEPEQGVCTTKECKFIAKQLIRGIDITVNPCDDFYGYVCGSHAMNKTIRKMEYWTNLGERVANTVYQINEILEAPSASSDSQPLKLGKLWYQSCMNLDEITKHGLKPIGQLLNENGGWPMITIDWEEEYGYGWQNLIAKYYNLGITALFHLSVEPHCVDNKKSVLKVDINLDENSDNFNVDSLNKVIKYFIRKLSLRHIGNQIYVDMSDLERFITELNKIQDESKDDYCTQNKLMTIQQFQEHYDSYDVNHRAKLDWLKLINYWFSDSNIEVKSDDVIFIPDLDTIQKLTELLGKTRQRAVVNYIQWYVVQKFAPYLTEGLWQVINSHKINEKFIKRWSRCVHDMPLKDAVGYEYVIKYVPKDLLLQGEILVDDLKGIMASYVSKFDWLTDEMSQYVLNKVMKIKAMIGVPDSYKSQSTYSSIYSCLQVGSNYFENGISYMRYDHLQKTSSYAKAHNWNEWPASIFPTTPNTVYISRSNSIVVPAALFALSYFSSSIPPAVKFSTIGFLIGHEFGHAIDPSGILYDLDGNYDKSIKDKLPKAYKDKQQCFINQYNRYTIGPSENGDPIHVDGVKTLNENMADFIGLQIVYEAFLQHLTKSSNLLDYESLPGLECFDQRQLFFVSYANFWCEYKSKLEYDENDIYPPRNFRIIGSLSNTEAFTKAFHCSNMSPMTPKKRCTLQ